MVEEAHARQMSKLRNLSLVTTPIRLVQENSNSSQGTDSPSEDENNSFMVLLAVRISITTNQRFFHF
jgi:hypothetical protein